MFRLFTFLWAFAILIHQGRAGHFAGISVDIALDLAALWMLLRPLPSSAVLLAGVQLATFAYHLPFETNHWWLLSFGDLTILIAALCLVGRGGAKLDGEHWFETFAPTLRVHLVILYVCVTLAKLNAGFFNPDVSCSRTMYDWLAHKLPFLPKGAWAGELSIYQVLVVEGLLPVALLWRKTRPITLILGTLFHMILGINGFFNFSASLLPLYALFAPPELVERARDVLVRSRASRRVVALVQRLARGRASAAIVLAAVVVVVGVFPFVVPDDAFRRRFTLLLFKAIWAAFTLGLVTLVALAWLKMPRLVAPPVRFRPMNGWLWITPILVTLNALCPFLGLKTESSFTMFSNVQTEGELWNHFVMPRAMRVFHFQDDLVSIVSSSDHDLSESGRQGTRYTFFAMQQLAAFSPDLELVYEYRGVRHVAPRVGDDPLLGQPPNPILAKLFWFRAVPVPELNDCSH